MEIIAHRGFRHRDRFGTESVDGKERRVVVQYAEYFENTIPALMTAAMQGFPIEFDVHATKDGIAVVSHDDVIVHRDDDAVRASIAQSTLAELRERDLVGIGNRVPTFLDVLNAVAERTVHSYIELKSEHASEAVMHTLELYQRKCPDIFERVTISSFVIRAIQEVKRRHITVRIAWGIHRNTLKGKNDRERIRHVQEFIRKGNIQEVHLELTGLGNDPRIVHWFKEMDCTVKVWTVNEPDDALMVKEAGAHGIFSDFPELMRDVL